jgi:hypothetical protein
VPAAQLKFHIPDSKQKDTLDDKKKSTGESTTEKHGSYGNRL